MKSVDYIFYLLFCWTCALCAAAFAVVLGVPWDYAIAHTLAATVVGTMVSMFLMNTVEFFIRHQWPGLVKPAKLSEADAAKSEPQSS